MYTYTLKFLKFSLIFLRPNFRRRKTKDLCATCESIWASDLQHGKLLARASGQQSSSMVSYLREHLGIRAPTDGFGTLSKSGSLGTVSGRLWAPKAEFSQEENQGSVRYLREDLGIRSPA